MARPFHTTKLEINEALLNQVKSMADLGLRLVDIAHILGISETTIHEYKNKYPELDQAYREGKANGTRRALEVVKEIAEDKADKSTRLQASKYWLNCRAKFSEKQTIEHTGNVNLTFNRDAEEKHLDKILDSIAEKFLEMDVNKNLGG